MCVSCYDVMMYVKEVTVFRNSQGEGNVSAGLWGSGKEGYICASAQYQTTGLE